MLRREIASVEVGEAIHVRVRGHWYPGTVYHIGHDVSGAPIFDIKYTHGERDQRHTIVTDPISRLTLPFGRVAQHA